MDINPQQLNYLREISDKIANGHQLSEVTITYKEEGEEKTITFTHPLFMALFEKAALEVHRRHNQEKEPGES